MLRRATTNKALIEAWPEIADIVEAVCPGDTPVCALPAVQMKDLNARLGLSKESV